MPDAKPRILEELSFERAAQEYERKLKPEKHLRESTAQAYQREITVESLAQVRGKRSDIHYFNELLIQYRLGEKKKIYNIVPDNFVVVWHEAITAVGSFVVNHQPARPFWALEYVSKHNKRKDYETNFARYEQELMVPYYLHFYPDTQDLSLFRMSAERYVSVTANERDRLAIPELELELAVWNGWVRYWFRGDLLLLPAELNRNLEVAEQRASRAEEQAAKDRQAMLKMQEEMARLRAQLGQPPS